MTVRVFAVIPTWNEAASLAPLLDELNALPPNTLAGTIVADAGSTDTTPEIARSHGATLFTQSRRGYGAACHEGAQAAREAGATHVLFLDGDGSDPPTAIPSILSPLLSHRADVVLGARRTPPGQSSPLPWHARTGNTLVCALLRWRAGRTVTDLPSMKALSLDTLDSLAMTEMGFGWTTELIAKSLRRGLRIQEVPVPIRPRTAGRSKVSGSLPNSARAAVALIRTAISATR